MNQNNIIPHKHQVVCEDRTKIKNHLPCILWFTGLSGSGKSTLASLVEAELNAKYRVHTYLLDGDNIRSGLNRDLGFSEKDREENIRRIGEVSRLFFDAGLVLLTAFISPFRADRDRVRSLIPEGGFLEIFTECPLEICIQRDPKGLYERAIEGKIPDFTGIHSPYESPIKPEIALRTDLIHQDECMEIIINTLEMKGIIKPHD